MSFDDSAWLQPPRLPLGGAFRGVCHASGDPHEPPEDCLRGLCNSGYARGVCGRFPLDADCDAMRYSLASTTEATVEIQFVEERDYGPLRHGRAVYDVATGSVSGVDGNAAAQAVAFIQSYLKRKSQ